MHGYGVLDVSVDMGMFPATYVHRCIIVGSPMYMLGVGVLCVYLEFRKMVI